MKSRLTLDATFLWDDLQKVRTVNPLIHNITNLVVMQQTANALLALGASPLMAHADAELPEIVSICNALVLNIGTLTPEWVNAMQIAQAEARQRNIPIILDPVGAGASQLRTQTSRDLLQAGVAIVRGNASEIMALAGDTVTSKGVDSVYQSNAALSAAQHLAETYHCVVVVSGAIDYIISTTIHAELSYGSPLMTKVVGLGCTATAIIGAFAAINQDHNIAALHAMAVMGIAGSLAADQAQAPGRFAMVFLDQLFSLTFDDIQRLICDAK